MIPAFLGKWLFHIAMPSRKSFSHQGSDSFAEPCEPSGASREAHTSATIEALQIGQVPLGAFDGSAFSTVQQSVLHVGRTSVRRSPNDVIGQPICAEAASSVIRLYWPVAGFSGRISNLAPTDEQFTHRNLSQTFSYSPISVRHVGPPYFRMPTLPCT